MKEKETEERAVGGAEEEVARDDRLGSGDGLAAHDVSALHDPRAAREVLAPDDARVPDDDGVARRDELASHGALASHDGLTPRGGLASDDAVAPYDAPASHDALAQNHLARGDRARVKPPPHERGSSRPSRFSGRFRRLVAALWFGSAVFLMLAAVAAFRAAPTPTAAADVVGAMLARWHYIALIAPLLLFLFALQRGRGIVLSFVLAGVFLASLQVFTDIAIRRMRNNSPVPISSLDRGDPLRRKFGALHGLSMMLLVAQAIAAGLAVALDEDP
ncbi:MAG TPA: hypothetical protein VF824_15050 [Thermoanaerobaculia bacterium]|jgi:hypothetical protein